MQKKWQILIVIVLLVLVAVGIYLLNKKPKTISSLDLSESEIQSINRNFYLSMKCVSECPIVPSNTESGIIEVHETSCENKCKAESALRVNNKLESITIAQGTESKFMSYAPEFAYCRNQVSLSEFDACLRQTLIILKERFNINE